MTGGRSSHLQQRCQELYLPGTHVSIDEMMVKFNSRSGHTVRIPSKPISVGFKVLALCDVGYTFSWLYTSRLTSIAGVVKETELWTTEQLCFFLINFCAI